MALARLSLHVNVLKDINTFEISVYQLNCSLVRYYGLSITLLQVDFFYCIKRNKNRLMFCRK